MDQQPKFFCQQKSLLAKYATRRLDFSFFLFFTFFDIKEKKGIQPQSVDGWLDSLFFFYDSSYQVALWRNLPLFAQYIVRRKSKTKTKTNKKQTNKSTRRRNGCGTLCRPWQNGKQWWQRSKEARFAVDIFKYPPYVHLTPRPLSSIPLVQARGSLRRSGRIENR